MCRWLQRNWNPQPYISQANTQPKWSHGWAVLWELIFMVHSLWVFIKTYRESFDFKLATSLKNELLQKYFLWILETAVFLNPCQWPLFILNKLQTRVYTFTLLPLIKRVGHFPICRKNVLQLHLIIIRKWPQKTHLQLKKFISFSLASTWFGPPYN